MDETLQIHSTIQAMTAAFHEGDLPGILRTYEPDAVVLGEPRSPVRGRPALEAMFSGFIAARARFTFHGYEVVQGADLALHLTPWTMTGVAPDQTPITASGLSVAVLRRQPDGRWLMVIDHPFGDAIAKATISEPER